MDDKKIPIELSLVRISETLNDFIIAPKCLFPRQQITITNPRNITMQIKCNSCIKNEWINVMDRLPEKVGRYLIRRNYKTWKYEEDIKIEWFNAIDIYSENKEHHRLRFISCGIKEDLKVTHWMPLPNPPGENDGTF